MIEPTPLTALFGSECRRALVKFFVHDSHDCRVTESTRRASREVHNADEDTTYRMSTLAEKLGFSREAVRVAAYKHEEGHDLQTFGVVDVVEKGITKQVQVADTEVVVALRETDTDVFKLLEAEGARHLVDFFVRDADPETAYLISEIEDASGIRWKTLDRHLPTLVDAHVVRTVERDGKTHYAADRVSATTERIIELNEVLYDAFADRR